MRWVSLAILTPTSLILIGASLCVIYPPVLAGLMNKGPHGLTTILYAFSSTAANNGSAFGGVDYNTLFYNLTLGAVMLLGRLSIIVPSLAIAGSFIQKQSTPYSLGSFSTETILFLSLLISVILIIGALTFFPALSLGPIVEHLLMLKGEVFG